MDLDVLISEGSNDTYRPDRPLLNATQRSHDTSRRLINSLVEASATTGVVQVIGGLTKHDCASGASQPLYGQSRD